VSLTRRQQPRRTSPEQWAAAKSDLRGLLVEAARTRTTVTYSQVALHVFGGTVPARSKLIMDLLGEVDQEEFARTGVIIASLVVRADSGIPGAGYFTFLAEQFGRDVSQPVAAWRCEAQRVWELYAAGEVG
jgi:hypothetical protein